jgi:hypothetical protein
MGSRTSHDKPKVKGANAWSVRDRRLQAASGDAGMNHPVVPPSAEAIRKAIESQICPWCGKGPYAMLPVHSKEQGVSKFELRELAGLKARDPLCSPDAILAMSRAYSKEQGVRAREAAVRRRADGTHRNARWTTAGLAQQIATITKVNARRAADRGGA